MKILKISLTIFTSLILLMLIVNNLEIVRVKILPDFVPMARPEGMSIPLFVVILASFFFGVVSGYLIEYFREAHIRRKGRNSERALKQTQQELEALKSKSAQHDDEVLSILK